MLLTWVSSSVDSSSCDNKNVYAFRIELKIRLTISHFRTLSCRSILRWRKQLGWTFRGSAYCQLIRQNNKEKRLKWAREYLNESEDDSFF